MSVINKMLRDLDHRQADASSAQPAARQGTASVLQAPIGPSQPTGAHARRWIGPVALVGVVAVAVGAALWMQNNAVPPAAVVSLPAAMPASAVASEVAPPIVEQPAVAEPTAAPVVAGEMVLRMEPSLSARRALDALLSTPAPAPIPTPTAATPAAAQPASLPVSVPASQSAKVRSVASAPTPAHVTASAAAPVAVPALGAVVSRDGVPATQRQQQAGVDAVAQAQNLWNTGSRDAAIDLVQQSIAVAERSAKAVGSTGPNPVLLPLVREMARMQLAEARHGAVWELLTRLESQLGNQPDLWAIRANAAQRLGRHPDSVHAYMMALQSRPDEQRWLLGTAVSLAALGQTSSAAEMAEKARAVGPVSKDILTYLRQAGVPLRD